MSKKINTNGSAKQMGEISTEEIIYPIDFDFKAVMDATIYDDDNKQSLIDVFNKFKINYQYSDKKISGKGTYASFTFKITIESKEIMKSFYEELKSIKGLKFAL